MVEKNGNGKATLRNEAAISERPLGSNAWVPQSTGEPFLHFSHLVRGKDEKICPSSDEFLFETNKGNTKYS